MCDATEILQLTPRPACGERSAAIRRRVRGLYFCFPPPEFPPMLPRCFACLALFALALPTFAADEPDEAAIRKAVTFYASFDEEVKGDFGGGQLTFDTRANHPTEKGKVVVEKGFSDKAFRVAKDKGISGGALEAVDVLPNNGR